jgi:RNA polymerase sigma-70 factor (ECF subfamily)
MSRPADDPLVRELVEGRPDAFARLYDQHGPSLFRVALRLLASRQDAEDAVQEVFVGLVRARRSLGQVENLRAYLYASLRRAAGRLAARAGQRPVPLPDLDRVAAAESRPLDVERSARLERAVRELPPQQRELIALKVDGGLTFAEVAACLGISPNTAASRYRYALEKLRAALEEGSDDRAGPPR